MQKTIITRLCPAGAGYGERWLVPINWNDKSVETFFGLLSVWVQGKFELSEYEEYQIFELPIKKSLEDKECISLVNELENSYLLKSAFDKLHIELCLDPTEFLREKRRLA